MLSFISWILDSICLVDGIGSGYTQVCSSFTGDRPLIGVIGVTPEPELETNFGILSENTSILLF